VSPVFYRYTPASGGNWGKVQVDLIRLKLKDVVLVRIDRVPDRRGFLPELYCRKDFEQAGLHCAFVQDNISSSTKGVLRGLHFQALPMAQSKLVTCLRGEIWDVVVDLRRGSPTFGKWEALTLSDQELAWLFVPKGFAHGFCVLSDEALVLYKVDEYYSADHATGIAWNDPILGIEWPVANPILSEKDCRLSGLAEFSEGGC